MFFVEQILCLCASNVSRLARTQWLARVRLERRVVTIGGNRSSDHRTIFIYISVVVMASFNVATVCIDHQLDLVAEMLTCLQHRVWGEDVLHSLKAM